MKRSTWIAVLLTAVVLVAAGNLPRVHWEAVSVAWSATLAREVSAWPRRVHLPSLRPSAPAPALAHARLAPHATQRPAAATPVAPPRPSLPRLLVSPVLPGSRPVRALPPLALLAGLAAAAVLTLGSIAAWRMRPDRRGLVFQMARRGHATARIARRAHVPQDAVRTLLTPGMGARR